jgi:AcrR family transcriptional regulator
MATAFCGRLSKLRANKPQARGKIASPPGQIVDQLTRTRKRTRAEKSDDNRRALINAAIDIVGEHGYDGASISRITDRAGLAQGTFYNYFESRQHILDLLIPTIGDMMLDYISEAVRGIEDTYDRERRGFRAFFEFLVDTPAFFRILRESEVATPEAWGDHFRAVAEQYGKAMRRALYKGHITQFSLDELEVISYMLMAARDYVYIKLKNDGASLNPIPDKVVDTYLKFIRYGLEGPRGEG